MLAVDQYAESALGNREFFLNKPHGIGGKKTTSRRKASTLGCVCNHRIEG
jgi:hypothetical protein